MWLFGLTTLVFWETISLSVEANKAVFFVSLSSESSSMIFDNPGAR
jgi:hypothetical protein